MTPAQLGLCLRPDVLGRLSLSLRGGQLRTFAAIPPARGGYGVCWWGVGERADEDGVRAEPRRELGRGVGERDARELGRGLRERWEG